MERIKILSEYIKYTNKLELDNDDGLLMEKAIEARGKSYSPYSRFSVGAAVLLENGQIILGNNQENGAYPSGMCAERVAVWSASSQYPNVKILKIAITGKSEEHLVDTPVSPCGACRQVLNEYEVKQKNNIKVFFMGEVGNVVEVNSIKDLLPFSFDGDLV